LISILNFYGEGRRRVKGRVREKGEGKRERNREKGRK
jgi:hypothetical protein